MMISKSLLKKHWIIVNWLCACFQSEQKQEETAAARADVDQTPPTESESSKPREPPKTPEPVETEEAAPGESSEKEESAEKEEEEEEKADTVQVSCC